MTFSDLRLRIRALLFPGRVERELQEELEFHADMQRRHGSRARFGSMALAADQCRDARGIGVVEKLLQDTRYALRSFRRAPIFALTVVGTIALGLGLNTAVFTIFNAYVLRPFAVRDPYALYQVDWKTRAGQWPAFSWGEFEQFRDANTVFTEVYAKRGPLITRIEGQIAYTQLVGGNYFRLLGVETALLGRTLTPDDTRAPGREAVAVLSHAFWQQHFGSDPAAVGRTMLVKGYPCEIVGVAREGFAGLDFAPPTDVWLPISLAHQIEDGPDLFGPETPRRVGIVGRLKPGVSVAAAESALLPWAQAVAQPFRPEDAIVLVHLESQASSIPMSPRLMLALSPVIAGFGLILLIACANVANMMLARGLARQRELGIRLTLGAARARLVQQLLTESVLLGIPSAVAAFFLSRVAIDVALRIMLTTFPPEFAEYVRVAPLPPDVRVFAFMMVAATATAVLFGLAPALQTTRSNVVQMARGDFQWDFGPSRLRSALVVAQIGASVTLLIVASVLVRSARHIGELDPGMRTRDVIALDVRDHLRARVVAALEANPIVTNVAGASTIPLDAMAPAIAVARPDRRDLFTVRYRYVSPSYFDLFDLPILSGRQFTAGEAAAGSPVAILSETAAARLWPEGGAVGRPLALAPDQRSKSGARVARFQSVEVVGITRDTAADLGNQGPLPAAIYFPTDVAAAGGGLVVRVNSEPEAARRSIDASLASAVPGAVQQIHKLEEFVAGRLYPFRAAYWVSTVVGVLALLLTISGVYGVLSYLVAQRTREISIRMALGADIASVVALVIGQALRLSAIGLPLGALAALGGASVFASMLMMIDVYDATAYATGMLVVVLACVGASCVPALRAARIDPMKTLRAD